MQPQHYLNCFSRRLPAVIEKLRVLLLLTVDLSYAQPAIATIQQQEEAPGQILYQSRHSLRDENNNTWQAILFKRVKDGQLKQISLRLVGFPDAAIFSHPKALIITTRDRKILEADDLFPEKSPSPNVGQYDFQKVLSQLPTNQPIQLILPLEKDDSLHLFISIPVVLEWQAIANA